MPPTDVIIRVKAFDDASPVLKQAVDRLKSFDGVSKTVGTNAANSAKGITTLGRGFLYAAGQAGPLNTELGVMSAAAGGVGLAATGAAIGVGALAAGIGKSIVAAVGFETAITRVAKTANLSAKETKEFGDAILSMSRRLPVATADLTKIAEVAGQLGISGTPNIAKFTEEIAKLASTTGVGADELATSLGTLAQVSGLPISEIGRLSASITELGNTSNSTEAQILDFSTRLVGIGTALNLPLVAITGISSAFAAAGVDAEAGSTAIQRLFIGIADAAQKGGDELQLFANVTGKTADQFKRLAQENPAEAFTQFIEGLKGVPNAIAVLDALGLADARLVRAVSSVANSQEPLRKSIETSTRAALEGTATNQEFGRSAETTAAKFQVLKNNVNATAIEVGQVFIPAIDRALDSMNELFEADASGGFENFKNNMEALGDSLSVVTDNAKKLNSALDDLPGPGAVDVLTSAFHNLGSAILDAAEGLPGIGLAISGIESGIGAIKLLTSDFTGNTDDEARQKALSDRTDVSNLFPGINRQQTVDALKAVGDANKKLAIEIPQGMSKVAGAGAHLLTVFDAIADGTISLSEALTLGLSDQQVVTLELAAAANKVAEAEYRRRIELQTLAQVFPGLTSQEVQFRLGLAAIDEHLKITGQTIEQFILDTSTSALNGFQSAFDAIFNKPTKESAQLQLQLDQLKRKKLLSPGADDKSTKAIDADIARVQKLIDIRNNEVDILKDKAVLADQTLLTDAALIDQAALLTTAIGLSSEEAQKNAGIVFLQTLATIGLKDQTLQTTTAIAQLGDAAANATSQIGSGTQPLSLQDALVALSGLPDHGQSLLPSFAGGVTNFAGGLARVHKNELLVNLPRGSSVFPSRGESGNSINVISYITVEGDATANTVALIKKAVREESENALRTSAFRGNYVASGAYTPQ